MKSAQLATMDPHLRDARTRGIPFLGSGAVYPVETAVIEVRPFAIPDNWPRAFGMDIGWNRCLAKDSMVLLPDGTERPIQDLKIGDAVLAFDFKTENLVPTAVVDTFQGYARNMVKVGISEDQTITCTDDHPFAHRGAAKDKIRFKKISQIKGRIREFQSVVLPSKWDITDENALCSAEMARVIGYLLGDGCLTYTNRRLEFSQATQEYIDDMRRCLQSTGCKMASYENNSRHHLSGVTSGKNPVLDFVKELGLLGSNSSTKFIPAIFFKASKEVIRNLLVGLIHTDGSVEGDSVRYYTVSKVLAEGVRKLCLRLGIYASLSCDTRKRKETHNVVYRVTMRRPTCLPLLYPKKLVSTRPERKRRTDRLLSKYESAPAQDIYCITVNHPDHAFVCNGFVVSNTAAIWGAWDRSNDIVYLYDEHYVAEETPQVHADAIKGSGVKSNLRAPWIRGVIDPAAKGRGQRDGEQLLETYRNLGLELEVAVNAVDTGIRQVWLRLSSGRLKVFSTLQYFFKEYLLYRRDENGKIIQSKARPDHCLDAARYLIVSGFDHMREVPYSDKNEAREWGDPCQMTVNSWMAG